MSEELCDEIELVAVIERLRESAHRTSEATKFLSASKTARNRAAGETEAHYDWLAPEQTLEWRAADLLQSFKDERKQDLALVLRDHWLVSVNCDHTAKTDRAQCSCSLVEFPVRPSVGDAVNDWVNHVLEQI